MSARAPRRGGAAAWTALALAALLAATLLAFAPAFGAGLLDFDDEQNLARNFAFRGFGAPALRWMATTAWMGHYQPLTWLSFAVDHALWGLGAQPPHPGARGFHATSVLLHGLTAALVLVLALRLLRLAAAGHPRREALAAAPAGVAAALVAALLFALHPLRVESVVWLTERRDVLSAPLFVLALLAWLRRAEGLPSPRWSARSAGALVAASCVAAALVLASLDLPRSGFLALSGPGAWGLAGALALLGAGAVLAARGTSPPRSGAYLACLALLLLSLLAKAWGIVLPALLVVLDVWPLGRARGASGRTRAARIGALALEKLPLLALAAVFAALAAWAQSTQAGTLKGLAEHGLGERAAQALYGLAYYPARTLWPVGLLPIYELPQRIGLDQARFLAPALAVAAATLLLVALRRRAPALLAAWVAFGVAIAPVLGLAQSGPQLVADRYSYLATLPFALLAGGGLLAWHASGARARWIGWALGAAAIALLAASTQRLAQVWQRPESLWPYAHARAPQSATVALSLGQLLQREAAAARDPQARRVLLERARGLYQEGHARRADPRFLSNLAQVEAALAGLEPGHRRERLRNAVELAREALRLAGEQGVLTPEYRLNYGSLLFNAGRHEEALGHLEWYVSARPDDLPGRLNLAGALLQLGEPRAALGHVDRVLALAPEHAEAWALLGRAREELKALGPAAAAYRRALELDPEHAVARERLAALLR